MMTRGKPSLKTKPLSEAHIEATCTEWLSWDGWRAIETDPKHLRGLGVSEPGIPDKLYLRYAYSAPAKHLVDYMNPSFRARADASQVMWIEWKRKGGKAGHKQKEWHERERARGALTLIASEDFPASIEGFCSWYQKSGLQRKSLSVPRL